MTQRHPRFIIMIIQIPFTHQNQNHRRPGTLDNVMSGFGKIVYTDLDGASQYKSATRTQPCLVGDWCFCERNYHNLPEADKALLDCDYSEVRAIRLISNYKSLLECDYSEVRGIIVIYDFARPLLGGCE
jgi:hypothetical protein